MGWNSDLEKFVSLLLVETDMAAALADDDAAVSLECFDDAGVRAYPRTVCRKGDRHILLRRLRKMSQSPTILG